MFTLFCPLKIDHFLSIDTASLLFTNLEELKKLD